MYATAEEVMAVTPYKDVTLEQVRQAQFVIEIYTGRTEAQVTAAKDRSILHRATIAQTVYMRDNPDVTFNQVKVGVINSGDSSTAFRDDYSPFVAPLAAMACNFLSWWNSRSIKVGKMHQNRGGLSPREEWVRD